MGSSPVAVTYTIDGYEKALVEISFLKYKNFDNVNDCYSNFIPKLMEVIENDCYSNFIPKLMEVIDKIAPVKNKITKKNAQEWFESEISEKLIIQDKPFKKYKRTSINVDKGIYKSARCSVQNFIAKKKKMFLKTS